MTERMADINLDRMEADAKTLSGRFAWTAGWMLTFRDRILALVAEVREGRSRIRDLEATSRVVELLRQEMKQESVWERTCPCGELYATPDEIGRCFERDHETPWQGVQKLEAALQSIAGDGWEALLNE